MGGSKRPGRRPRGRAEPAILPIRWAAAVAPRARPETGGRPRHGAGAGLGCVLRRHRVPSALFEERHSSCYALPTTILGGGRRLEELRFSGCAWPQEACNPNESIRATSAEGGAEHMRINLRAWGAIAMATILCVWARSAWAEEAPAAGGTQGAPAANAPPPDPTRGKWDSFLDPLRDFEDDYVVGTQKSIEDATGIHIGAGIQEAWSW